MRAGCREWLRRKPPTHIKTEDPQWGNASFNVKASVRGSPVRWLILGGVSLVAGIVVGTAMMVGVFRERALQSAERELDNTVLLLTRHFDQQLEEFVTIQREVAAESARLASPEAFKARMSSAEEHEALRAKVSGHADVAGINVFDADGQLINSSESWRRCRPSMSATATTSRLSKAGTERAPLLIELLRGPFYRWLGQRHFVQDYRTQWRGFVGAVTRAVTPSAFERFFATLSLGDDAAISMYHRDGTLLARYPHIQEMIGQNFASGPVHQEVLSKADHGTLRLNSPIDGMDRLASARRLSEFPISIHSNHDGVGGAGRLARADPVPDRGGIAVPYS